LGKYSARQKSNKIQGVPMSGFDRAIRDELPNKEFRESYVAENVRRGLAYQIRALREGRGWSPAEFSRQAGKPQSNISRWEDPTYGKFNLSTLIEIASVFDVALSVRFVPFSRLLAETAVLTPQSMAVSSYDAEKERLYTVSPRIIGAAERAADESQRKLIATVGDPWASSVPPEPTSADQPKQSMASVS
jgi:transcriptional regulator with XRE-family HTH domain